MLIQSEQVIKMVNYAPYIIMIGGIAVGMIGSIITALEFGKL